MLLDHDIAQLAQTAEDAWHRLSIHRVREADRIRNGEETDMDRYEAGKEIQD